MLFGIYSCFLRKKIGNICNRHLLSTLGCPLVSHGRVYLLLWMLVQCRWAVSCSCLLGVTEVGSILRLSLLIASTLKFKFGQSVRKYKDRLVVVSEELQKMTKIFSCLHTSMLMQVGLSFVICVHFGLVLLPFVHIIRT